jgi:hypothetical protein
MAGVMLARLLGHFEFIGAWLLAGSTLMLLIRAWEAQFSRQETGLHSTLPRRPMGPRVALTDAVLALLVGAAAIVLLWLSLT